MSTRYQPPVTAQRRNWVQKVCANADCGETFVTAVPTQIYCAPNCRFRAIHRAHAWRERAKAGKPLTPLQRLIARLEAT